MKEGYIKQDDRKKILLLTDDIRVHSGVAQIGREIISKTSHRYNWCQLAGSVKHPEKGKVQDISADINKQEGIEDTYCKLNRKTRCNSFNYRSKILSMGFSNGR